MGLNVVNLFYFFFYSIYFFITTCLLNSFLFKTSRNVYGTSWKREYCYDNIRVSKSSWDSTFCSINTKFIAVIVESAGGGAFIVLPITKVYILLCYLFLFSLTCMLLFSFNAARKTCKVKCKQSNCQRT